MIRYTFEFSEEHRLEFEVIEDSDTSLEGADLEVPEWLALEHERCPRCTLEAGSRRSCPAALALEPVLMAFSQNVSYEAVHVIAEMPGVTLSTDVALQRAVRSLVGLRLALSACPVLRKLRPMAHFHQPFIEKEQTAFRYLATHLIAQYLRQKAGLLADWELETLDDLFRDLHMVNKGLANRIRTAVNGDATINSIVLLDNVASIAQMDVDDHLAELKPLFGMYLED